MTGGKKENNKLGTGQIGLKLYREQVTVRVYNFGPLFLADYFPDDFFKMLAVDGQFNDQR